MPTPLPQIIVAVAINGERPALPDDAPPVLAGVIRRCWREDPRGRPSAAELVRLFDLLIQASPAGRGARGGGGVLGYRGAGARVGAPV